MLIRIKGSGREYKRRGYPGRPAHAGTVEKFLGLEKINQLRDNMKGWYGRPIFLVDVPGSLWITRDGDFVGHINTNQYSHGIDMVMNKLIDLFRASGRLSYQLNAGFSSVSDIVDRASQGYQQSRNMSKTTATGVVGAAMSCFRTGTQPAGGSAPAAAGAGTAFVSSDAGALAFANPAAGTNRLVGADLGSAVTGNALLIYDLLYGVSKTINSTANEAVTGVPTRYQSSTVTDEAYAGDNFLFIQVGVTALAAVGHNWGVAGGNECLYRNQAGTDNSVMPVLAGISGANADRLDMPLNTFFAPLAAGDTGIMDLAQMRCSALVTTGTIYFMIGHPLGIAAFPIANTILPFDWITNRRITPRIFDNAFVAFIHLPAAATTANTYTGAIYTVSTSS